ADADRVLSRLPRYRGRSELGRLLETLDRIAVLARRPALVFVAIVGVRHFGGSAFCNVTAFDRNARPFYRARPPCPPPLLLSFYLNFDRGLPAACICLWRLVVGRNWAFRLATRSAAPLFCLFFRRRRHRSARL